jgi:hypothetical protein
MQVGRWADGRGSRELVLGIAAPPPASESLRPVGAQSTRPRRRTSGSGPRRPPPGAASLDARTGAGHRRAEPAEVRRQAGRAGLCVERRDGFASLRAAGACRRSWPGWAHRCAALAVAHGGRWAAERASASGIAADGPQKVEPHECGSWNQPMQAGPALHAMGQMVSSTVSRCATGEISERRPWPACTASCTRNRPASANALRSRLTVPRSR